VHSVNSTSWLQNMKLAKSLHSAYYYLFCPPMVSLCPLDKTEARYNHEFKSMFHLFQTGPLAKLHHTSHTTDNRKTKPFSEDITSESNSRRKNKEASSCYSKLVLCIGQKETNHLFIEIFWSMSSSLFFSTFEVSRQAFYRSSFSYAIVNLKPIVPGRMSQSCLLELTQISLHFQMFLLYLLALSPELPTSMVLHIFFCYSSDWKICSLRISIPYV